MRLGHLARHRWAGKCQHPVGLPVCLDQYEVAHVTDRDEGYPGRGEAEECGPRVLPECPFHQGGYGHPVGDEEEYGGDGCVEVGVECASLRQEAPVYLPSLDCDGCHVEQSVGEGAASEEGQGRREQDGQACQLESIGLGPPSGGLARHRLLELEQRVGPVRHLPILPTNHIFTLVTLELYQFIIADMVRLPAWYVTSRRRNRAPACPRCSSSPG